MIPLRMTVSCFSAAAAYFLSFSCAWGHTGSSSVAAAKGASASPSDMVSADEATTMISPNVSAVPERFVMYRDDALGAYIKPLLWISASLAGYVPKNDANEELSGRLSTLAMARFGVEGQLIKGVTFRSVFERNVGYSIARNGPVGTSIWEGTASLQARENYIRLERWGLSLAGGIVADPASQDFVSLNVLQLFGMDPYVRDPLLLSGFSLGQGFVLRYSRWGATAGVSFTAGNPLVSSLSFGFGGNVSALGTLFTAPLRALANGIPGSDIHMQMVSPSLSYRHRFFEIRTAAQLYFVDVDLTQDEDESLFGYNLRGSVKVNAWKDYLSLFVGGSYRQNQQLDIADLSQRLEDDFTGMTVSGGIDFNWGDFGAGAGYYRIVSTPTEDSEITTQFINVGMTYWIAKPWLSVGARYSRSMASTSAENVSLTDTDSFLLALRLMI